jgi:ethanolamine utilization protein EutP
MRRLILIGRSEAGKSSLIRALRERYEPDAAPAADPGQTQAVDARGLVIDTPGEYAEARHLGGALAVFSYEADVIGLLLAATEPYSLFSPCCAATATRPVIGIVTQCDRRSARPEQAAAWLRLAGCEQIFFTSSKTGQGIDGLLDYLGTENKQNSTFL